MAASAGRALAALLGIWVYVAPSVLSAYLEHKRKSRSVLDVTGSKWDNQCMVWANLHLKLGMTCISHLVRFKGLWKGILNKKGRRVRSNCYSQIWKVEWSWVSPFDDDLSEARGTKLASCLKLCGCGLLVVIKIKKGENATGGIFCAIVPELTKMRPVPSVISFLLGFFFLTVSFLFRRDFNLGG